MTQSVNNRFLFIAFVVALIFAAKFAVYAWAVTPLWDIPDEPGHYSYAEDMSRGQWPRLGQAKIGAEVAHSWINPQARPRGNWIAQHPPLFYALDAPVVWAARAAHLDLEQRVRAARTLNALFGGLTVLGLALFLARATGYEELGLAGAIFFAATPMFTHLSTGVTHDVLVACSSAWAAYWCTRWLETNRFHHLLYAGVLIALATVTKITSLALAVPLFFVLIWRIWRTTPSPTRLLSWLGRCAVLWLVMFTPICLWIIRNQVYFDRPLPDSSNLHHASIVPIGFFEFMTSFPIWEHTLLNFIALVGWNGSGNGTLAWIQANGLLARYFLGFIGAASLGVLASPGWPYLARTIRHAVAALGLVAVSYIYWHHPIPHLAVWTSFLLLAALTITLTVNTRALFRAEGRGWLLSAAAICTLLFSLIYFEHLRGNFGGAMRATHGRYLYPVVPFLLLVLVWPFRSTIARHGLLCAAVAAMLFSDGFYLRQVFDLYGQTSP